MHFGNRTKVRLREGTNVHVGVERMALSSLGFIYDIELAC
jgi:hypothetical protein